MAPQRPRRPDPEPLEVDERPVIVIGMAVWVVAFVVLLVFFRADLRRHDAQWWLWSCGVGFGLGLYALHFARKRRRGRTRQQRDQARVTQRRP